MYKAVSVIFVCALIALAGCAPKMCHNFKSQQDYSWDYNQCKAQAYQSAGALGGSGGVNPIMGGQLLAECLWAKGWYKCPDQ